MHESSLIACDFSVSVDCATFRFWLRSGGLLVGAVAVVRRAVVVGSGGFAQTQVARSSERPPTCEFWGHGNPVTGKNLILFISGKLVISLVLRPNCCSRLRMVANLRGISAALDPGITALVCSERVLPKAKP
jgi:hypothetical protein